MTDDEDSEEPAVTLGTQRTVEGAPLARVTARLMWGIEKSAVREREGGTVIRTPDGPRELGELLDDVDQQYFATRQEFEDALADVIGDGPIPVESDEDEPVEETEEEIEETGEADEEATEQSDTEPSEADAEGEDSATAEGTPESTTDDEDPDAAGDEDES